MQDCVCLWCYCLQYILSACINFSYLSLSWSYFHPCFSDVVVPDGWVSLALLWSTLVSRRDCEVFLKRSGILPVNNPFAVAGQSFPQPIILTGSVFLWDGAVIFPSARGLHHLACMLLYNLPLLCIALLNELLQARAGFTDLGSRATRWLNRCHYIEQICLYCKCQFGRLFFEKTVLFLSHLKM